MPTAPATPLSPFQCACLLAAAAVTLQLFYAGAQPAAAGLFPAPWDKLAHFVVYGAITVLLWIGTAGRTPLAIVAGAIAIGAFDELHQSVLPGRTADTFDFLVDVAAVAAAAGVLLLHEAHRKARLR